MNTDLLFQPGRLGSLAVPNRIVMPPMVLNYADEDGRVTDRYIAHIERVARGGVGTIVLEASYVTPEGRGFRHQLGVHDDGNVPGLRRVVDVAHRYGAVIGIQLYHAGRQTSSTVIGGQPVAPSSIPCPLMQEMPAELSGERIAELVRAFGEAARRAIAAGLDFVEIHAAHGYLVNQFLSPFSNRRTDRYGGSFDNRTRFLDGIIDAVRRATGNAVPVTVRISADEMVPGGITIDDSCALARHLETKGVDALHVSAGNYGSYTRGYMIPPMAREDAPLVDYARRIKAVVSIPVIAVGKLRDPAVAAGVLERGDADFVAIGRGLLADPDWPAKVRDGRRAELNLCVTCNQGCIGRLFAQQDALCTINPETGREALFANQEHVAPLRFAVIGAGPAGMTAARIAALRGHDVTVYERANHAGGQLDAAGAAPHRENWWMFRDWLACELKRLNVPVRHGRDITDAGIVGIDADAFIIATGSRPHQPPFLEVGDTQLSTALEVLERRTAATTPAVVVGGGCSGAQVADYLAESIADVTVVEAGEGLAADMPMDERALLLARLEEKHVQFRPHTRLLSVEDGEVLLQTPTGHHRMRARTAVMCLGTLANDELASACTSRNLAHVVVGDAREPRKITEATAEAALAVLELERQVGKRIDVGRNGRQS